MGINKKKFQALFITAIIIVSVTPLALSVKAPVVEDTTPLFTLHALMSGSETDQIAAATIWKEELAKIGINLEIQVMDEAGVSNRMWGDNWNKSWEEGGWDLGAPDLETWWWNPISLLWWQSCWTSAGLPPLGWNNFGWTNGRADMLVNAFLTTFDYEERAEYMNEWQEIFVEDPPVILTYYPDWLLLHNKELYGFDGGRFFGWGYFDDEYCIKMEGKTLEDYVSITTADAYDAGLVTGWNPLFTDGLPGGGMYIGLLSTRLTTEGYELKPYVAKSWEWSEDHMSMTFYLRDDVYWDDGVKLTADDVVFSVDAIKRAEIGSMLRSDFDPVVDHAEALNETTVKVYTKVLYPDLAELFLSFYIVPKHTLEDVPYSQWKTDETNTEGGKLPGCGPYVFKEWVKNDHITKVKSDTYFAKDNIFIDEIISRVIPDPMTALAALEAGEIDILDDRQLVTAVSSEVPRLEEEGNVGVLWYPRASIGFVYINRNNPILTNRHVVRAIWYALPLERIRDEIFNGNGEIANSVIYPTMPFYDPDVQQPTYDLEKAKDELAMAGYVWPREVEVQTSLPYVEIVGGFAGGFVVATAIVYVIMRRNIRSVPAATSA